ncbi:hypothetical protein N7495_005701, partial [Penicillium taxi]|uniref:uncharacterized protein n=1 Tax=Penicillium taxi TaxID=168475 RepID=UPI002545BB80
LTQTIYHSSSPPQSRLRRFFGFASIAVTSAGLGLYVEAGDTISRMMTAESLIKTDAETLNYTAPDAVAQEIVDYIHNLPEVAALRENPDFKESRPHLKFPVALSERSLTAGTLSGPKRIPVPPLVFNEREGKSLVSFLYLGSDVCGHPGIVHGGLLATLLDEGLARCCFEALPNKVGVTANLNLDYRAPAMADSYIVLRAETVNVEGRKAWVEGRIETIPEEGKNPVVLVEAKALFIEPRQASVSECFYFLFYYGNITFHAAALTRQERNTLRNQQGLTIWLTGLSASGKSTIAVELEHQLLHDRGVHAYRLDGDNIRFGLNKDLGFSETDRNENIRRIAEVAKLFADSSSVAITSFISPYRKDRDTARQLHEVATPGEETGLPFVEVYIDVPVEVAEKRDPKGLYKKAREGVIKEFTGISAPYEAPVNPEVHIKSHETPVPEAVKQIIDYLDSKGYLPPKK